MPWPLTPPLGPTGERFYAALLPPFIARITGAASRFEVTEEAASLVRSSPTLTPLVALDVRHGLALMAVYHGDVTAAEEQYQALHPTAGTLLPNLMSADRVLGLLARTCGDGAVATAHFEHALTFCRQAGYRPELAWTCHDYAEALLDARGPWKPRAGAVADSRRIGPDTRAQHDPGYGSPGLTARRRSRRKRSLPPTLWT